MTERFTLTNPKNAFQKMKCGINDRDKTVTFNEVVDLLNELNDKCEFLEIENKSLEDGATKYAELYHQSLKENEQLKQQKTELLRIIENNIEIYENINTNVEFHQGEIQGKLTVLNNLREVILND